MPQTKATNEVNVKVLPKEEAHLVEGGVIRSDSNLPLPANVYFGQMEVLSKPEPISAKPKQKKK